MKVTETVNHHPHAFSC